MSIIIGKKISREKTLSNHLHYKCPSLSLIITIRHKHHCYPWLEPFLIAFLKSRQNYDFQSPSPFWAVWGGNHLAKVLDFVFIDTEHTPLDRKVNIHSLVLFIFIFIFIDTEHTPLDRKVIG